MPELKPEEISDHNRRVLGVARGYFPEVTEDLGPTELAADAGVQLWGDPGADPDSGRMGQAGVLRAVAEHDRVAIASGHATGKTFLIAWLLRWFTELPGSAAIVTANTWTQVKRSTMAELCRCWYGFDWPGREPSATLWRRGVDRQVVALSTRTPEAAQGIRAPRVIIIVDEASGERMDELWEPLETLAAARVAKIVLAGNTTRRAGIFAEAVRGRRGFFPIRLSSEACVEYQEQHGHIAGLMSRKRLEEWEAEHGRESDFWRVRVEGKLPKGEWTGWFPPDELEGARRREPEDGGGGEGWIIGYDSARTGADKATCYGRLGSSIEKLFEAKNLDHAAQLDKLMLEIQAIRSRGQVIKRVAIDATGEGSGLADMVKRQGLTVDRVHPGGKARQPDRFKNRRAEGFYALSQLIRSGGSIPDSPDLQDELEAHDPPELVSGRGGAQVWKIRPKDDIKMMLGRSPDDADGAMLSCVPPQKIIPQRRQLRSYRP